MTMEIRTSISRFGNISKPTQFSGIGNWNSKFSDTKLEVVQHRLPYIKARQANQRINWTTRSVVGSIVHFILRYKRFSLTSNAKGTTRTYPNTV